MSTPETHAGVSRDARSRSERLFLAVIVSAVFTSVITANMVNVLLPDIRSHFGASPATIGWIVTVYSLVYAIGIPIYGRISDLHGTRRIFVIGLSAFVLGSLLCASAPALAVLFAGRVVQAAGGAAIAALGIVVVSKVIPEARRGAALGLVASSAGLGSAVGPISGGLVGELTGWRGLFLIPMVIMLLLIPVARRVLPDDGAVVGERFDAAGGVVLGLGIGLLLLGISQGQVAGFAAPSSWGSFLAAGVLCGGFAWRNATIAYPFVPPDLLRNGAYLRVVVLGFLSTLSFFPVLVVTPLLLAESNGLTPREAGLVLTPASVVIAVGARYSGRLSDRVGPKRPIVGGLAVLAAGVLALSTIAGAAPWLIALAVIAVGAGSAFVNAPMTNLASRTLAREHIGIGMGLQTGASFLGGGVGVAVVSALLTARQEAASGAINPFYGFEAAPYADAYLAILVTLLLALGLAASLPVRSAGPAPADGLTGDGKRRQPVPQRS